MLVLEAAKRYTYTDYAGWDTDDRYELIDGVPYLMSPGPNRKHQEISGELYGQLRDFLKGKPCKVYHAPFDVRLDVAGLDNTVVQPDIMVICDHSKLGKASCDGAPDLVVEILSPSTSSRDKLLKFNKYLQSGVREYWIVDPDSKTLSAHVLENGKYITGAFGDEDTVPVKVLPGCRINLHDVFAE